jgi:hypothetical protein
VPPDRFGGDVLDVRDVGHPSHNLIGRVEEFRRPDPAVQWDVEHVGQ